MKQCPRCRRMMLSEATVCPYCGEVVPETQPDLDPQRVRQLSRKPPLNGAGEWALALVGYLVGVASPVVWGIGYIIAWIVYGSSEKKDRPFMRGMYYGLLTVPLLLLGAFAICMYFVVRPGVNLC